MIDRRGGCRAQLRRLFLLCAFGLAGVASAYAEPQAPGAEPIAIEAHPILRFRVGSEAKRFGALEYRGGFRYKSRDRRLAGISSIRMREGGTRFLAVSDTGLWFSGRILRDAEGRPAGIDEAALAPILNKNGQPMPRKGDADAEGLAIDGDRVLVSFERDHRVESFANPAAPYLSLPKTMPLPIPRRELRSNGGLETVAVSPKNSPLKGRAVVVAETSVDGDGNLFAAVLGGSIFKVRREEPWAVTDGAFLPGGDLLLLERRYEGFGRLGMRIRRIAGETIRPGALVDGPVIVEADLGNEIDNMEGLDVWQERGETYLSLVSDNNGSFFQRNLYLEFRLIEGETASAASPAR